MESKPVDRMSDRRFARADYAQGFGIDRPGR
jgi:hypothetical protein